MRTMVIVASEVDIESNGMSTHFMRESVKDTLKWNNLSVKKYTHIVMNIGKLYLSSEDEFKDAKSELGNEQVGDMMSLESLNSLAKAMNGV